LVTSTTGAPSGGDWTLLERVDAALRSGAHNVLVLIGEADGHPQASASDPRLEAYRKAFPNLNVSFVPQRLHYRADGSLTEGAAAALATALRATLPQWRTRPAKAVLPGVALLQPNVLRVALYVIPGAEDLPLHTLVTQIETAPAEQGQPARVQSVRRTIHLNGADGVCVVYHAAKFNIRWKREVEPHLALVGTENWGAKLVIPVIARVGDATTWQDRKTWPPVTNARLLYVTEGGQWGVDAAELYFRVGNASLASNLGRARALDLGLVRPSHPLTACWVCWT
jgi:hypothetical protein